MRQHSEQLYPGIGETVTEVDHVIPVAKGGTDDPSNLVPACGPCNRAKGCGSKMPLDRK